MSEERQLQIDVTSYRRIVGLSKHRRRGEVSLELQLKVAMYVVPVVGRASVSKRSRFLWGNSHLLAASKPLTIITRLEEFHFILYCKEHPTELLPRVEPSGRPRF